jgi:Ankyrin repeats (3 copies)
MTPQRTFVRSLRRAISDKQSNPTLLRLAKCGKFDAMIQLLNGDEYQFYLDECADAAFHEGTLNMFMGKSTLQLVMTYRPPVELVDLLIRRCREHNPDHCPEDSIDMQGRTPLHVAVEYGCSLETCKRLMADNLPVIMKDQQDRTPLHCACSNIKRVSRGVSRRWSRNSSNKSGKQSNDTDAENTYQVICALVAAYPEATQIPNAFGKTPIMLAMEQHAERRILTLLTMCRNRLANNPSGCQSRPSWDSKSPFEASFTITSGCSQDDLSSVGSCGISTIEI